ncbi:MAG: hypothetical protein U1F51_16295 [Burkholderiales bacterium]
MSPEIRSRRDGAGCVLACATTARGRRLGVFFGLLAALAVALTPSVALAANGERLAAGTGGAKADDESLRYDGFSGFNCSQSSFTVDALAHLNIAGPVSLEGTSTLGGVPYDSYFADLGTGPDTFPTNFGRDFTGSGKPPGPSTPVYEFVFNSIAKTGNRVVGRSVTTIRCTNGALSASNRFFSAEPESIPVDSPAALLVLGLALALAARSRFRRDRG